MKSSLLMTSVVLSLAIAANAFAKDNGKSGGDSGRPATQSRAQQLAAAARARDAAAREAAAREAAARAAAEQEAAREAAARDAAARLKSRQAIMAKVGGIDPFSMRPQGMSPVMFRKIVAVRMRNRTNPHRSPIKPPEDPGDHDHGHGNDDHDHGHHDDHDNGNHNGHGNGHDDDHGNGHGHGDGHDRD